jgi:hypothetical protein
VSFILLTVPIDPFSIHGFPWVLIALWNIWMFQPVVTFFHELGHAWAALLLTREKVTLSVGQQNLSPSFSFCLGERFLAKVSLRKGKWGYTQYNSQEGSISVPLLILLSGPLMTLLLTCSAGYFLFFTENHPVLENILISWFCANFLTLMRAVLPMRMQPSPSFPEGPPSDGLQVYHLLFPSSKS